MRSLLLSFLFSSFFISSFAQVGINTSIPDDNSVLDLNSGNTKGLLIPRLTTTNRETMSTSGFARGMMVYDTDLNIVFVGYGVGATLNKEWYALNPWKTVYKVNSNIDSKTFTSKVTTANMSFMQGNVGIGTTSPAGNFTVKSQNRQISIINSGVNNYAEIRAHSNENITSRAYFNISGYRLNMTGNNGSGISVDESGNVGIGTTAPSGTLEVTRGTASSGTAVFGGTNRKSHFNYSTAENTYIRGGKTSSHVFINDNGGNVGIGTTTPTQKLHISGNSLTTGRTYIGTTAYFYSDKANRIATPSTFYVQSSSASTYLYSEDTYLGAVSGDKIHLRSNEFDWNTGIINSSGNVGIGTTSPSYPLHVVSSITKVGPYWRLANAVGVANNGLGAAFYVHKSQYTAVEKIGMKVDNGILSEFIAFNSDERIKEVIGVSNSEEDLSTLLSVEVTDYKKKDKIRFGEKISKKLIAQQLKTVFPEAVSLVTDVIPDIYKAAEIKDGHIALETDLEKGDRVKLIFEDKEEVVEVIKADKKGFSIADKKDGKVFVYGKEVDDFHVVDYTAVSMLNVSATQELYKLILKQQKLIENQKTEIKAQTTQLEVTKKNQSDFDKRIRALESRNNISTSSK